MSPDERAFLKEELGLQPAPLLPASPTRLAVIILAMIVGLVAIACGISYLVASRTAARAALKIAPDLGRLESDFGMHHRSDGRSTVGWEFDYGPSELGPISLQLYVGLLGEIYQTQPPEAMDRVGSD